MARATWGRDGERVVADIRRVEAGELLGGTVLVLAPHMDDEALACGGTLAMADGKERVHVLFATDGARSPIPPAPWVGALDGDLARIREREARRAVRTLGIPERNARFLHLPDGGLGRRMAELERSVAQVWEELQPDQVLAPFRYDRHPDHLAVNRVATRLWRGAGGTELLEYFVYWSWRSLPAGDVRRYVRPDDLVRVEIGPGAGTKRKALACYETQTTCFYDWQTRPNLTEELLEGVCSTPELFLRASAARPGAAVLRGPVPWIRIAHRLEPMLKAWKDRLVAVLRAGRGG